MAETVMDRYRAAENLKDAGSWSRPFRSGSDPAG